MRAHGPVHIHPAFRRPAGPAVAAVAAMALLAAVPGTAQAQRSEGAFQRTLATGDAPDVEILTGSGSVDVRAGSGNQVQVDAKIRANDSWGMRSGLSAEERVRRLEADPPIQQTGNAVRIGHIADEELRRGVSISYVVTVPPGSRLQSRTGSGSQEIRGVSGSVEATTGSGAISIADAGAVRATTGSGSITARDVRGSFEGRTGSGGIRASGITGAISARTGSGSIELSQAGQGDVQASSGSGSIELQGVRGGVQVSSSSGHVTVQGELAGDWQLSTSSGGIDIDLPAGQGFQLDASTTSGSIETDFPVTVTGTVNRRSLRGATNGGGPRLQVRTTSGSISIR